MADLNIIGRFIDQTKPGVDSAERRVGGLRGALQRVTPSARTAGLAIAGIAAAGVAIGVKLVADVISTSRELSAFAERAGASAEALQTWGRIAEESGGSVEDVADAMREMNLRLAEAASLGSGPAVDALDLLGLSLEDLKELEPEEQFRLIRDAIAAIEDPALKTFAAEELLGGSSERLTALLQEERGGLPGAGEGGPGRGRHPLE